MGIPKLKDLRRLIKEHHRLKDDLLKREKLDEIIAVIHENYGIHPPDDVQNIIYVAFGDRDNAEHCICLGNYYQRMERYKEAIDCFLRSHEIDENYKSLHNLATLYSYTNQYKHSIDIFKKCLNLPIVNLYHKQIITYNYGFTLNLAGEYEAAGEVFKTLIILYNETEEADRNADYWRDVGDHYLYNMSLPFEAVASYEEGLKLGGKNNIDMLLGLVNACNKCASLLPNNKEHNQILLYKRKVKTYFAQASELIGEMETMPHAKQAELHFYNKNYEQAKSCYETLLKKDMSLVGEEKGDAFYFVGLCSFYSEQYDDAIKYFNESIHINNVEFLDVFLAQCYLKKGNFRKTEDLLDGVLEKSSFNTNALICQVFLYSEWAEKLKVTNSESAVNYFELSAQIATKLLAVKDSPKMLRSLTDKEYHELKYAISYCHVEKCMLLRAKSEKIKALLVAKSQLSELAKENNNLFYFRSGRTLHEVERVIDDFNKSNADRKRPLIAFGLLSALLAIFMIFVGKPVIKRGYLLDTDLLAAQLAVPKAELDSVFSNRRFVSTAQMVEYVNILYGKKLDRHTVILPKNGYYTFQGADVKEEIIIFLLSVGVVFVLLGYLTSEIKVLKVGVIHIEKSEQASLIDQVELKMAR